MTEYETASLAIQHATLELSYWQSWAAFMQVGAALLVGLVQCGLLAWGISVMKESNTGRDAILTSLRDQSQVLADIGAALRDQSQAYQDQRQASQDQGQALADIGAALRDQRQTSQDQSQAFRDQGQALRDQSQALADIGAGIQELLRERRPT